LFVNKVQKNHECRVKDGLKTPCPICNKRELVFYSRDPIVLLPCGHGLHFKCFSAYLTRERQGNDRCPLCIGEGEGEGGNGVELNNGQGFFLNHDDDDEDFIDADDGHGYEDQNGVVDIEQDDEDDVVDTEDDRG